MGVFRACSGSTRETVVYVARSALMLPVTAGELE